MWHLDLFKVPFKRRRLDHLPTRAEQVSSVGKLMGWFVKLMLFAI